MNYTDAAQRTSPAGSPAPAPTANGNVPYRSSPTPPPVPTHGDSVMPYGQAAVHFSIPISPDDAAERVANLVGDDMQAKDLFCQMDVLRSYKDDLVWKEMASAPALYTPRKRDVVYSNVITNLAGDDMQAKDLFCQMDVLRSYKDDLVWKEMARWVRYEEAVEEGGERWSKPHVASLMMEALQDLQNILSACPVLLDSESTTMAEIADECISAWLRDRMFSVLLSDHIRSLLLKPHKFQHYVKKKTHSSLNLHKMQNSEAYINAGYDQHSDNNLLKVPNHSALTRNPSCPDSPSLALGGTNKSFMRKIPPGSEVVNILVGEVPDIDKIIAAFVRLKDASNVGDITEVELNTRFMFIVLGPQHSLGHCAEMCRCMATLFTDEIFRCVVQRAEARDDILSGMSEFSLHLTVLPPGTWDPSTRIEPPDEIPSQDYRKDKSLPSSKSVVSLHSLEKGKETEVVDEEGHGDPTLVRTGRVFGGLIQDIKRKIPHYVSDFKDALHIQCVASFFFLFLATLTPNVTFGGLLTTATDEYMGAMECILAACISGTMFALFSGQPLNILGSTGPMLVLEAILYRFCKDAGWDFMPFRVWVGFWTGFMILLIVAFDLSALVRYITRFTEESFACLIALIFIYEAFKKTFGLSKEVPPHLHPPEVVDPDSVGCFCLMNNDTFINATNTTGEDFVTTTVAGNLASTAQSVMLHSAQLFNYTAGNSTSNDTLYNTTATPFISTTVAPDQCAMMGGTFVGEHCSGEKYVPDAFFFSVILFFATFFLANTLVHFRHSLFFPTFVRTNVSDFAVLISIIIMVILDSLVGLPTPKLAVPNEFKPTKPGRPWFINPISDKNPWWLMILSAVPAVLATILIFMDQQITAVIVNRRENKLKKGSGYHLDMLVVAILVVVHGLLGLPWYVAATVTALAHIMSLKKVSECTAPGEKPTFLGVREQRVTGLMVGIFSGLAVLITSVLNYIPMAVLYGVFLFMGVAPLGGMQLVQRIMLVFMPAKYQPDYSFIRNVPIRRVHLFTMIQVLCLAVLWVVKSIKSISIAFPLMVLIICFIRKAIDKVFTQRELKWLDDILPATSVKKEEPVKICIDDDSEEKPKEPPSDSVTRSVSAPVDTELEEVGKTPYKSVLEPRMSLTFICKTDLDRIKAIDTRPISDRRQSLILAVERKRSLQMYDGAFTGLRRISRQSSVEGRSSNDGSVVSSHPHGSQHSIHQLHGSTHSIVDDHNKLNRLLSLPATIVDEDESDSDKGSKDGDSDK